MPLSMAKIAIKKVPDHVLDKFRAKLPAAYAKAICKENLIFISMHVKMTGYISIVL